MPLPDRYFASPIASEIVGTSKVTIHGRSKYIPLGKFAMLAEVNGEEAMEAFWDSTESVSCM
jgi:hypothetical protein